MSDRDEKMSQRVILTSMLPVVLHHEWVLLFNQSFNREISTPLHNLVFFLYGSSRLVMSMTGLYMQPGRAVAALLNIYQVMKKIIPVLACTILSMTSSVYAQQVRTETIAIQANGLKGSYPALSNEYAVTPDVLTQAVSEQLKKTLGKSASSKKCYYFQGVTWTGVTAERSDVYYTVTGSKNVSKLTVAISKGYDNFINPSADIAVLEGLKQFLTQDVNIAIRLLTLRDAIKKQEAAVAAAEKEHQSAIKESNKLKTKLDENEKAQEKAKAGLDENNALLEKLRQELKGLGN